MIYAREDLNQLEKRFRVKLINGITGFKPANLIGTVSDEKEENLAIFSSIVHVGSNPPLIGLLMRPITVVRHTYENIMQNGHYTINAFTVDQAAQAHATSAKHLKGVSEFEECGFESTYIKDFPAPFVKGAPVGIGCKIQEEIEIKTNGTRLIVGNIELLQLNNVDVSADGYPNLSAANTAALSSLDGYHPVGEATRFEYAKPNEATKKII